uniref:F-box domain-containing protein n=1 Tax=Oryza glumipatula TaxID=40148 RepID=A0A0D9ZHA0_9ORYZ
MAEAATRELPPVSPGLPLPEELVVWEILVRLPPKPLLRCRLVCRAWRRLTSTRDFLLAHHRHQPSLPLIAACEYDDIMYLIDVLTLTLGRRTGVAARLHPVARYASTADYLDSSRDGLLLISWNTGPPQYSICNPTTRQFGDLPLISGFMFLGLYQHRHTGDYRILLCRAEKPVLEDVIPGHVERDACYAEANGASVLLHGSLHWYKRIEDMILAFDITAESFRWMRSPFGKAVWRAFHGLFEINCMLGMYCCDDGATFVDIWVLEDYEREVWSLKYRVELPVLEIRRELDVKRDLYSVMVSSEDGDVLVLVNCKRAMLYIGTDGKLLASLPHDNDGLSITPVKLRASLVPHAFFPSLLDYVVNASPFINFVKTSKKTKPPSPAMSTVWMREGSLQWWRRCPDIEIAKNSMKNGNPKLCFAEIAMFINSISVSPHNSSTVWQMNM